MKKVDDKVNIRLLQMRMLIAYALLSFFSIYVISTGIINISKRILEDKVSSLVATNCQQIELNTNNYFNTVEAITTLLFADEEYYKYDPIADEYDEYERIKKEDAIADRIADLGLMQNFSDFAVIYSNGNRVGWTSNTTAGLYESEELYTVLSNVINNTRTEDGWAFGIGGTTDRLYYVKRLNKNAIITTSFYARELETAFEYPTELEGMVINLVDKDNTILYSSEKTNIGGALDENIAEIITGHSSKDYIANVNWCENGWSVVCAIPVAVILKEANSLRNNAIMLSFLVAVVMIVIGFIFLSRSFKPVDSAVEELKEEAVTDKLSGLLNKQSFNSEVIKQLANSKVEATRGFIMIDMDNFKQVNDTLGHAYGDEVIVRMGHLVSSQFGPDYTVGRVGGDEFAVYTESAEKTHSEETQIIIEKIKELFEAFEAEFSEEKKKVNISLSVGVAIMTKERRFDNLYKAADEALYTSKKSGKNRYTLYEDKVMA